ncbi:hypothetical protein PO909_016343, partial [Leuciscus waleckii]
IALLFIDIFLIIFYQKEIALKKSRSEHIAIFGISSRVSDVAEKTKRAFRTQSAHYCLRTSKRRRRTAAKANIHNGLLSPFFKSSTNIKLNSSFKSQPSQELLVSRSESCRDQPFPEKEDQSLYQHKLIE